MSDTNELEALARRAVAAGFEPRFGCVGFADGLRCVVIGVYGELVVHAEGGIAAFDVSRADFIPDLSDAATLGCLLALVREAGPPVIHRIQVGYAIQEWMQGGPDRRAAALVAALEAAPEVKP